MTPYSPMGAYRPAIWAEPSTASAGRSARRGIPEGVMAGDAAQPLEERAPIGGGRGDVALVQALTHERCPHDLAKLGQREQPGRVLGLEARPARRMLFRPEEMHA